MGWGFWREFGLEKDGEGGLKRIEGPVERRVRSRDGGRNLWRAEGEEQGGRRDLWRAEEKAL